MTPAALVVTAPVVAAPVVAAPVVTPPVVAAPVVAPPVVVAPVVAAPVAAAPAAAALARARRQQLHVVGGEQAEQAARPEPLPPARVDLLDVRDDVARVERYLGLVRCTHTHTDPLTIVRY